MPAFRVGVLLILFFALPSLAKEDAAVEGKKIFETFCIVCHGETGKGDGSASASLDPKPRDFTDSVFKFSSSPQGLPPSDDDLFKTISKGSPGTAMPPWEGALSEKQRKQVIAYIKTFNPGFWKRKAKPVKAGKTGTANNPDSVGIK